MRHFVPVSCNQNRLAIFLYNTGVQTEYISGKLSANDSHNVEAILSTALKHHNDIFLGDKPVLPVSASVRVSSTGGGGGGKSMSSSCVPLATAPLPLVASSVPLETAVFSDDVAVDEGGWGSGVGAWPSG